MRVLQVVTDTDRRGAMTFAVDLAPELETLGHEVETVALSPGVHGARLDLPVLGFRRLGLSTLRALRARARGADVAIAHGSTTLVACAAALAGSSTPFVYRQISDLRYWQRAAWRRAYVSAALGRAERVVALWSGSARLLRERLHVAAARIDVIPNAVPAADFRPATPEERTTARHRFGLPPDAAVIVYVGSLVAEKGVGDAVRAAGRVPYAHLLVVGDGPERDRLAELAASEAPGRVTFAGTVADRQAMYWAADCCVLPSRGGDSMPAVLIEAGLSAVPAVATPIDGIPEITVDGLTGRLVPPDEPAALTDAILEVLDQRDELGAAARARCAQRFDIVAVAGRWRTTLERAAGVIEAAVTKPA